VSRADEPMPPQLRKALLALVSLLLLVAVGTAGFHLIEGWSFWDAFYMVIISITTTGYGEVHPLSHAGRLFAMFVILSGVGVGSYSLVTLSSHIFEGVVEGSLRRALARRRMQQELPKLANHTVVCGYGRLGQEICLGLRQEKRPLCVIEPDPGHAAAAEADGFLCIHGDATDEDMLRKAGVDRAATLAAATPNDAVNTYVVLTAREINPRLRILARASDDAALRRLKRAGADQVVNPMRIGGQRMAAMLVRPAVVDFLDLAQLGDFPDIFIEELRMADSAKLAGRSIRDAHYNDEWRVLVLAVRQVNGTMCFRPEPDLRVDPGDILIVAGHREDLKRLESSVAPPK
jgi:voltage-gated potassium channel